MLPLRDNIPTSRHGVRHVRADRGQRPRLLLLAARRALARRPEQSRTTMCQLQDWAAIPKESSPTTPSASSRSAQAARTDDANPYLTIFTAMFMHGGLLHLGGNMLFLWIFGNNVEDAHGPGQVPRLLPAGRRRGARAAGRRSTRARRCPTLGASGAIAAVLGGYLLLFPRAKVVTVIFIVFFFTILELPALLVLGLLVRASRRCSPSNSIGSSGRRGRVLRARRRLRVRVGAPSRRSPIRSGWTARPSGSALR